jgi:tRNA threonylcarbamoyladenosine biosynthesis protein TsaE
VSDSISIRVEDEEALQAFGAELARGLQAGDWIALSGELGAGKTTLARGILRGLGHTADVPSPTFTLVQVYQPPELRLELWHADLYRIADPDEVEELGLADALAHAALLVEWPERLAGRLGEPTVAIGIEGAGGPGRLLTARFARAWER